MEAIRNPVIAIFAPLAIVAFSAASKEESFKDALGPVKVAPVEAGAAISLPYITWGGDIVTFYANGGLKTAPGALFQKQGFNFNLTAGDDFVQQVRNYLAGKTPFLRGTVHMMGLASEAIGED